jgi:hypothetical protein
MDEAKDYLKLYYENVGVSGSPATNWMLENKSTNKAIKATIFYSIGHPDFGNTRTESFSIEPGEIKNIGNRTGSGPDRTHARISGARYL